MSSCNLSKLISNLLFVLISYFIFVIISLKIDKFIICSGCTLNKTLKVLSVTFRVQPLHIIILRIYSIFFDKNRANLKKFEKLLNINNCFRFNF